MPLATSMSRLPATMAGLRATGRTPGRRMGCSSRWEALPPPWRRRSPTPKQRCPAGTSTASRKKPPRRARWRASERRGLQVPNPRPSDTQMTHNRHQTDPVNPHVQHPHIQHPPTGGKVDWVQCDACDKWRRVAAVDLPGSGSPWYCSMNTTNSLGRDQRLIYTTNTLTGTAQ